MSATRTVQIYDLLHGRLAKLEVHTDYVRSIQTKAMGLRSLNQNNISLKYLNENPESNNWLNKVIIQNYILAKS